MKQKLTKTRGNITAHELAHIERQKLINKPFPPMGTTVQGRIWAGNLITHDDDALFLKGQRNHNRRFDEEGS